jgi:hypothetical protein
MIIREIIKKIKPEKLERFIKEDEVLVNFEKTVNFQTYNSF